MKLVSSAIAIPETDAAVGLQSVDGTVGFSGIPNPDFGDIIVAAENFMKTRKSAIINIKMAMIAIIPAQFSALKSASSHFPALIPAKAPMRLALGTLRIFAQRGLHRLTDRAPFTDWIPFLSPASPRHMTRTQEDIEHENK